MATLFSSRRAYFCCLLTRTRCAYCFINSSILHSSDVNRKLRKEIVEFWRNTMLRQEKPKCGVHMTSHYNDIYKHKVNEWNGCRKVRFLYLNRFVCKRDFIGQQCSTNNKSLPVGQGILMEGRQCSTDGEYKKIHVNPSMSFPFSVILIPSLFYVLLSIFKYNF